MRRLALVPAVAVTFVLLTGCSSVAQIAGEAAGVPVEEICTGFDGAYEQYEALLAQGDATEEQIEAARDDLVTSLEGVADGVGGQVGDLIRTNARTLAESTDLTSPESIQVIEQLRDSVATFCG